MTPSEAARELYRIWPQERTFEQDLAFHVESGYVWSSPKAFILATFQDDQRGSCWFVHCHVGPLSELFRVCPHPSKFVGFVRRGRMKVYDFDKMRSRCLNEKG